MAVDYRAMVFQMVYELISKRDKPVIAYKVGAKALDMLSGVERVSSPSIKLQLNHLRENDDWRLDKINVSLNELAELGFTSGLNLLPEVPDAGDVQNFLWDLRDLSREYEASAGRPSDSERIKRKISDAVIDFFDGYS